MLKNIYRKIQDRGIAENFLDLTPKTQSIKEKADQLHFIKI